MIMLCMQGQWHVAICQLMSEEGQAAFVLLNLVGAIVSLHDIGWVESYLLGSG